MFLLSLVGLAMSGWLCDERIDHVIFFLLPSTLLIGVIYFVINVGALAERIGVNE